MSRDTIIAIAHTEARHALDGLKLDASLEDRFRTAFKVALENFMAPTREEAWTAGCEAVYINANAAERDRITVELKALHTLGAMLGGLPIDVSKIETPEDPIGIRGIFMELLDERQG